jgi:hypothetical protein
VSLVFLVFVVVIGARFQVVEGRDEVLLPDGLGLFRRIVIGFFIIVLVFALSFRRRER